jgi:hypothetical protein
MARHSNANLASIGHLYDLQSIFRTKTLATRSQYALIAAFCLLGLWTPDSRAQSNPTRLDTVSATVANNVVCSGAAQNFSTSQGITNFINIGQTGHLATATSNASVFQMEIDGIDNIGNIFRLSDLQLGVPSSAQGGIVVTANGYMPNIRISVICSAGATFSISYSGSFSPQPQNLAGVLLNATDKLPFQTAPANTNNSKTFQTPTGNSAGTIVFQYSGVGPAGSTITAQCISNAGVNLTLFTFSPTTAATPQLFSVASGPCPFVNLSYTSGGASAVTYSLEYVFVSQGAAQTTTPVSVTNFPVTQPVTLPTTDPCMSSGIAKLSAPVPFISAAGTTQIVALVGGQKIYPCAIQITQNWGGTNFTYAWEYGTGVSCGTGTTALSGAYSVSNADITTQSIAGPTLFNIPTGNALCIVVVGNPSPQGIAGFISYVQQ